MSALHTKRIVSVPDILFPTPWARRPNSLAADLYQVLWYFGCFKSCRYFSDFPLLTSNTSLIHSVTYQAGVHVCWRVRHRFWIAMAFCTVCRHATRSLGGGTLSILLEQIGEPVCLSTIAVTTLGDRWMLQHIAWSKLFVLGGVGWCNNPLGDFSHFSGRGGRANLTFRRSTVGVESLLSLMSVFCCPLISFVNSFICSCTPVLGMPFAAVVKSVSATINLSMGVISGFVIRWCWNITVSNIRSALVF